jgi:hypothetical protein
MGYPRAHAALIYGEQSTDLVSDDLLLVNNHTIRPQLNAASNVLIAQVDPSSRVILALQWHV